MHEWALAEGVVTTALKAAEEEGMKHITRIVVSIGELQQIETEIFRHALQEVMPMSELRLASVEFALQTAPALFRCRVCRCEFSFREAAADLSEEEHEAVHFIPELAHTYFRCPECGSTDFEVVKGRGVWIDRIEGEG